MTERTSLELATEARAKLTSEIEKFQAKTPVEIATYLREQGITGVWQDAEDCPLARYFKRLFPEYQVTVYMGAAIVYVPNFGDITVSYGPAANSITSFITFFDGGDFTYLRDPEPGQDVT